MGDECVGTTPRKRPLAIIAASLDARTRLTGANEVHGRVLRADGYTQTEVLMKWREGEGSVRGVEDAQIPQFTVLDYRCCAPAPAVTVESGACAQNGQPLGAHVDWRVPAPLVGVLPAPLDRLLHLPDVPALYSHRHALLGILLDQPRGYLGTRRTRQAPSIAPRR